MPSSFQNPTVERLLLGSHETPECVLWQAALEFRSLFQNKVLLKPWQERLEMNRTSNAVRLSRRVMRVGGVWCPGEFEATGIELISLRRRDARRIRRERYLVGGSLNRASDGRLPIVAGKTHPDSQPSH